MNCLLNGIHETLLDLVEDHDAEGEDEGHDDEAVDDPAPADEIAAAEEAVFEGFDDGGDGVEAHEGVDRDAEEAHAAGLAERIDNRGGIHPELDQKTEEYLQVAVFGRHRGDDGAEAEGQACQHDDQQGEQQGVQVEVCVAVRVEEGVNQVDHDKEAQLDGEAQQVADDIGNRHHQAREIDLAEDCGVGDEGIRGLGQALCKVVPHRRTGEVEKRARDAVGRDPGDAAEDNHIHDDGQGGLHDKPDRAQDRLLVLGDDVALDEQGTEVAVGPQLLEVHGEELVLGLDDDVPRLLFGLRLLYFFF